VQPNSLFLFAFAAILAAQPNPGTLASQRLYLGGAPTFIDAAGNVYATASGGPAQTTPGAAQRQSGGGLCFFGPHPGSSPCNDALIVKSNPSGNTVFATLLGGSTNDSGTGVTVDAAGSVYIIGTTGGSFSTTPDSAIPVSTTSKAFAAKLTADGSKFLYSTYLPDVITQPLAIAVDPVGNAYIAGNTASNHACIVALRAEGSSIIYTKVLAGPKSDAAVAITIDSFGDAILAGSTSSPDFPVSPDALQPKLAGVMNAFLTILDGSGNLMYSTFLGGSGTDQARDLKIDSTGNILIGGSTESLNFPTTLGTFQPSPVVPAWARFPGGFIVKLSLDARSMVYSSYVSSGVWKIAAGSAGDVYVAGGGGVGFPVTTSAPLQCAPGNYDTSGGGILVHLDATGTLADATYVPDDIAASAVVQAADGSVFFAGELLSKIRFGDPGWIAPFCMTPSILNSATLAVAQVVPGEFVSISGRGIGPAQGLTAPPASADGSPTSLGGVRVLFDGVPAPVFYAQSLQVNAQAPFELAGKTKTTVTLEFNGASMGSFNVPIRFGDPGLFRLQPNISAQALAVNSDGTINSPNNPAARGSVIALWGTGFGSITPACPTGGLNPPGPADLGAGLSANIYGGDVVYAGSAPYLPCGIVQINVQIPMDAAPGPRTMNPESMMVSPDGTRSFVDPSANGSIVYVK
jgi:uncharacterized protein (TIGR03437 family)